MLFIRTYIDITLLDINKNLPLTRLVQYTNLLLIVNIYAESLP